jgi:hypothetical protein
MLTTLKPISTQSNSGSCVRAKVNCLLAYWRLSHLLFSTAASSEHSPRKKALRPGDDRNQTAPASRALS